MIGTYFGRLGMGYDFMDWVVDAQERLHMLNAEAAARFHINYKSMQ
jgi:hypothetical protein